MAKVMSLLEKYNLVEKVNKVDSKGSNLKEKVSVVDEKDANLNEENNIKLTEELKGEENIPKDGATSSNEGNKKLGPAVKENPSAADIDLEYENKMMVNDIYSSFGLENSEINTVFMLQNLINALPQNLPQDVIKQSVMNIITASSIDLNELLSDGKQRLKALDKIMDEYNKQTSKRIAEYKGEIDKLSSLINNYQEQIKIKEAMLEDQTYIVKYETQKIDSIMDFFKE